MYPGLRAGTEQATPPSQLAALGPCSAHVGPTSDSSGGSLAEVDRGEEDGVRDERGPEPARAREHHEITHPPENHLQSGRGGVSTGPWGRRSTRLRHCVLMEICINPRNHHTAERTIVVLGHRS